MTTWVGVPEFWSFRLPCTCPYGSLVAVQSSGSVIATEEQAWDEFYEGDKRDQNKARADGNYVTPVEDFDTERFLAGHDHPECTKG